MSGPIVITLTPGDRLQLATTIERLINLLDEVDGDCDFEPSLADFRMTGSAMDDREGDDGDDEHSHGWGQGTQERLHASDEREEENEHGGDIQDEPHDKNTEGDEEPFLGWPESCCQERGIGLEEWNDVDDQGSDWADLRFDRAGYINARNALRKVNGQPLLRSKSEPYDERATPLSDGSVFRTFVVPEGFVPNRVQNHREPDRLFPIAPGVMRVGF